MKEAKARSQAELYATNMEKVTIGGQAVLDGRGVPGGGASAGVAHEVDPGGIRGAA